MVWALSDYRSMMKYVPELDFGVFVSINQASGARAALSLPNMMIEKFFPEKELLADIKPDPEKADALERFEGDYMANRRNFSKLEAIFGLFGRKSSISVAPDGALELDARYGISRWIQVGPLSFRKSDGADLMSFYEDDAGTILRYQTPSGTGSFEKVSFYDVPEYFYMALGLAGFFTATFLLAGIYKLKRKGIEAFTGPEWFGFYVSAGGALFYLALLYVRESSKVEPWRFMYDFPGTEFTVLVFASLLMAGLMISLLFSLIPLWRTSGATVIGRLHQTLYAVSGLVLISALWKWNLLGFYWY